MLKSVTLYNFKAFKQLDLQLGGLTLLSGLNGTGKSSVLQSLALLRQSHDAGFLANGRWLLNGELVELGTGADVGYADADDEVIGIALEATANLFKRSSETSIVVRRPEADVLFEDGNRNKQPTWNEISLFSRGFQYLRADRISPSPTFPKSQHAVSTRKFLGARGEYVAHFLLEYGEDEVEHPSLIRSEDGYSKKLISQVNAWMQDFSPGVRVSVTAVPMTDLVRLEFSYRSGRVAFGPGFRSTNVGFGLTHSLPIIVACLAAKRDSVILLENPEAQLHPQGQMLIGELLARLASSGVQVILETHSDHILNGIRLAVKSGALAADRTRFHFFSRAASSGSEIVSPTLNESGMLSDWPPGFFTQWDDALIELLS